MLCGRLNSDMLINSVIKSGSIGRFMEVVINILVRIIVVVNRSVLGGRCVMWLFFECEVLFKWF